MLAATVLCGAATAACGPIVFVGLMVPHVVRSFTGPDLRWILPYAAILSPVLLLGADVVGRVVARPVGGPGRHRHRDHRRAGLHLSRTAAEDGPAVKSAQTTNAQKPPRGPRALRTPGGLSVRLEPRTLTVVVLLAVVALAAGVVLIGTGDFPIPAGDVLRTLFGGGDAGQEFIVNELRLPRVLVGLLVGASLGLGGALFQSISRNPLGSPDVLGLRAGGDGRRARR